MIDALPAAVYTTDAEGRITHFNPAAVEFSGRTPELGTDQWCVSWKLYHPDGTPMPHDECPMAIALKESKIVRGTEAIIERPDGTRRWFTPYPTRLRDAEGRVVGGINMLVDITERKQAEEALRRSQVRDETLVQAASQIVWTTDANGMVVEDSPSWRAFTGQSYEQWKGFGWLDVFHPDDRERIKEIWQRAVVDGIPIETEYRIRHASGEWRWTAVRAAPVLEDDGSVREWVRPLTREWQEPY